MTKRFIMVVVDNCPHCKSVDRAAEQLARDIGYEFQKRKPSLTEVTQKRWKSGYPAFVLEWGTHSMEFAGDKVVPTLSRHKAALIEAKVTPAQLAGLLRA